MNLIVIDKHSDECSKICSLVSCRICYWEIPKHDLDKYAGQIEFFIIKNNLRQDDDVIIGLINKKFSSLVTSKYQFSEDTISYFLNKVKDNLESYRKYTNNT